MRTQMTQSDCPIKIEVGSVIRFTNNRNYEVEIVVGRTEEKSWYPVNGGRNSYGTLVDYSKKRNFRVE